VEWEPRENGKKKHTGKTGSVRTIAYTIAYEGAVTRKKLKEKFESSSLRTTIYYLKRLNLVYSKSGRIRGFVVSIPYFLFLMKMGVDWKYELEAKIGYLDETDLASIENTLKIAENGALGDFVKELIRDFNFTTSLMNEINESSFAKLINKIRDKCSHVGVGSQDTGYYYEECLRPMLQYVLWLPSFISSIIWYLRTQPSSNWGDLQKALIEQSNILSQDTSGSSVMEIYELYPATMYITARILRKAIIAGHKNIIAESRKKLLKHYEEEIKKLNYYERYNMKTVLVSFIDGTIRKIIVLNTNLVLNSWPGLM